MAGTRFSYVKDFENDSFLLPRTFIVIRVDGRAFSRFTETHEFGKPNDERGLRLMDRAARCVMEEFSDIVLGFGESDEFSFLLRRSTTLYNRREAKILSTVVSQFTAAYIFNWTSYFAGTPLHYPPTFDARITLYPSNREVRDYFSWRQADTHINNLYNTAFWALIQQGGQSPTEAHATLRGTGSTQKHEMLFSRFNINYNDINARFRKGSVLVRANREEDKIYKGEIEEQIQELELTTLTPSKDVKFNVPKSPKRPKTCIRVLHEDLIRDDFWIEHSSILDGN